MPRFEIINGERHDFTPEQEAERDAQEAAWAAEVAARKESPTLEEKVDALFAVATGKPGAAAKLAEIDAKVALVAVDVAEAKTAG